MGEGAARVRPRGTLLLGKGGLFPFAVCVSYVPMNGLFGRYSCFWWVSGCDGLCARPVLCPVVAGGVWLLGVAAAGRFRRGWRRAVFPRRCGAVAPTESWGVFPVAAAAFRAVAALGVAVFCRLAESCAALAFCAAAAAAARAMLSCAAFCAAAASAACLATSTGSYKP